MTAYLQPGDKIHIAFGLNGLLSAPEQQKQFNDSFELFKQQYGYHGVKVVVAAGSTSLTHPVIVSVIRSAEKPKLVDDLPWQDPAETTERPPAKEFLPHGHLPE